MALAPVTSSRFLGSWRSTPAVTALQMGIWPLAQVPRCRQHALTPRRSGTGWSQRALSCMDPADQLHACIQSLALDVVSEGQAVLGDRVCSLSTGKAFHQSVLTASCLASCKATCRLQHCRSMLTHKLFAPAGKSALQEHAKRLRAWYGPQ